MPSHSEPSLEAGLSAVKQGDYQSAIATLEAVAARVGKSNALVQAQIGLVVAYGKSGDIPRAIALCETLTQSQNPQVKQWANRTLEQLTLPRQDRVSTTDVTGFVPFEQDKGSTEKSEGKNSPFGSSLIEDAELKEEAEEHTEALSTSSLPSALRDKSKLLTIHWRQATRAKSWQRLQHLNLTPFRLLMAGTFIALFWVMRELLVLVMRLINGILVKLPYLEPLQLLYANPTLFLLLALVILIGFSPWLLDGLLTVFYGRKELERDTLEGYSKETVRLLQRCCQQRGWKLPKLFVLPLSAPVALTYGNLPRTARIVVSQGLLDKLADDEIATVYASQLGHIAHWDFVVMSLVLLVTILAYKIYQQLSQWGDRTTTRIWRAVMAIMANLAYGVWCLLTGTSIWLSQLRLYYSDCFAVEITGNPNGLVRALLKIAIGIAADIQKQEHTSWQLESLNILAPVGYQQSICLGSIAPHTTFESFFMWDSLNPYRWWFVINNTHPLIGDRLQRILSIARHWHLETELNLESQQPLRVKHQSFLFQCAPFLGILLGVMCAILIWLIWQTAYTLKFLNLKWIYDGWSFVTGCLLIGFSIGILIRTNSFFPDIKLTTAQTDDRLPDLLSNPAVLPSDSMSVRLVGKLLGRRGTSNCLGQDLILQSSTASVKLHHIWSLGQQVNPQDLIGRQITVTGWLRRGATPWIDIQTLQTQSGTTLHSPHPIWSTVLAVAAEAWGAYILLKG
ncbi:Zn-dependent protease with chaperone function [Nostocales cyanobacterium HT-58-2]|nr:Zn-dependent protease with chaperone function [Nostocales cyanobacterium HT-58-2]